MPSAPFHFRFVTGASFCIALAACGGDNLSLPDLTEPAQLEVISGSGQAGSIGTLLAEPLVVRVLDSEHHPVSGVRVAFMPGTGASGSTVQPDTAETDGDGRASVRWALGTSAGGQTLIAQVVGSNAISAAFSAMAGAGVAASLEKISGDNQSAVAGSPLPDSLIVRALDASSQPVGGVTVNWSVVGGGSVSTSTTVTRTDGRTGVRRTLGPAAGAQSTIASLAGVSVSDVTFASTATVGSAGALRIEVQPASTAKSGSAFTRQPQLQLIDANGNPVLQGGLAVTAQVGSGPAGASLIGSATASTNSQGLAVFTNLGISGPGGTYALNFSGPEASGVTSEPIQVSAGEAVKLAMVTQPPGSVAPGAELLPAPVVRLEDGTGNAVASAGVLIAVSLTPEGTLGGTLTASTDASGQASFPGLSITGSSGPHTLLFSGSGLQSIASSTVQVVSTPDKGHSTLEAPESAGAGEAVSVKVTVHDANGFAVTGASVTLSATGAENTISPSTATTDANGVALFSFSSTRAETKSLTAHAGEFTLGPVPLQVIPGAGDPEHTTAKVPDGRTFRTTNITVEVRDRYDNRLTIGGSNVKGSVAGANASVGLLTVEDKHDGTYHLSYTPFFKGDDLVSITLAGVAIKGSPYVSHVK